MNYSLTDSYIKEIIFLNTSKENLFTFDPYDIWKTLLGVSIKKLYNYNKYLGIIPAGILTVYDLYINNNIRFFYKKQEYPIVRALAILSLLNLFKIREEGIYLQTAQKHAKWLMNNYSLSDNGIGWGLGFTWPVDKNITYNANTPFSTHTPYVLEALFEINKYLNDSEINLIYEKIFLFFDTDIQIMFEDECSIAISYGPIKDRIATNATSYALNVYSIFYKIFPEKKEYIKNKAKKLYNYLKINQGEKGEWLYTANNQNSFIDCFHSCFILQNLIKAKGIFHEFIEEDVIIKGWNYIKITFYDDSTGLYKRFSQKNKIGLIKFDLYDNAEVLTTAIMLKDDILATNLLQNIFKTFYRKHEIYSGVAYTGILVNKNTLRWAVMPFIYSLSLYQSEYVRNIRFSK